MMAERNQTSPKRIAAGAGLIFLIALFMTLGVWQLERRAWKLDLIHEVNSRVHAPAEAAPGPAQWANIIPDRDSYRHVTVHGVFLNRLETPVRATTVYGPGYWIVTPFKTDMGFVVLVNRGFVPPDKRDASARPDGQIGGETEVTGLLRMTEPHGRFLQPNVPKQGRWYSRDVTAIAAYLSLPDVAPYFIDADAGSNPHAPVGGLTVITFPNNHLVYAITWFGMALLSLGFTILFLKDGRRKTSRR